jgi:hypothetical protein
MNLNMKTKLYLSGLYLIVSLGAMCCETEWSFVRANWETYAAVNLALFLNAGLAAKTAGVCLEKYLRKKQRIANNE